jgi:hypothetical protein
MGKYRFTVYIISHGAIKIFKFVNKICKQILRYLMVFKEIKLNKIHTKMSNNQNQMENYIKCNKNNILQYILNLIISIRRLINLTPHNGLIKYYAPEIFLKNINPKTI